MPIKRSIHIGLNEVDPTHYSGWSGKLNAPTMDAIDMYNLCKSLNYDETLLLLNKDATRNKVIEAIIKSAQQLRTDDLLFIYYSGHGGRTPDINGDEEDGTDETWCLYDGQLIDDELLHLWVNFKKGVRVFVISDSCHSGTILKLKSDFDTSGIESGKIFAPKFMPDEISQSVYLKNYQEYNALLTSIPKNNPTINCSVKLISACQDNEVAQDGPFNSLFTAFVKIIWNGGNFSGNYNDFYDNLKSTRGLQVKRQIPNYYHIGAASAFFDSQRVFQ